MDNDFESGQLIASPLKHLVVNKPLHFVLERYQIKAAHCREQLAAKHDAGILCLLFILNKSIQLSTGAMEFG